jgi:hypothetical protein
VTPQELSDRIAGVLVEVAQWSADPRDWGRPDLDGAVEVWDRIDRLMTDLAILRRDHSVTLARRINNEQTAYTRDGSITIHRDVPRNERWDGHRVLGELAIPLVDATTGEMVEAVPVDIARAVIPACVEGQTSSRWKVTELRKIGLQPETFREVDYGDAVVARGPLPSRVRHARPPVEPTPDDGSPQLDAQDVDKGAIT